jgi:hypothetical protein
MIQRRRRTRFPAESFERFWTAYEIVREELQGHHSAEFRVNSLVHDTHTAAAQFFKDAIMTARHSTDHQGAILPQPLT